MLFHAGPQELVNYEGKSNHYRGAGPRGRKRQDAIPIMVGGKGRRRTLKTLAQSGDIMNVISSPELSARKRASHFASLSNQEIASMERALQSAYQV